MRTQIYLEPSQHAALIKESRRLGLSLAGIIRKLVDDHFSGKEKGDPSRQERKKAFFSLVGLGDGGIGDISENVDEYLGKAIYEDMVKERRPKYKVGPRKRK